MTDDAVRVADVMTPDVRTIHGATTVREAAHEMHEADIGSVLVVDDDGPTGILTESDVVALVGAGDDLTARSAAEAATSHLVTVERTAPVEAAAERMTTENVKKLPVAEDGDVVGIVTTTDVSAVFPRYHPQSEEWGE